jgi:hypothetical protein
MMILPLGWMTPVPPVTTDAVMVMMKEIPGEYALDDKPAGFDRLPYARTIAAAIAQGVTQESDPWKWASLGVVYEVYESANRRCAIGDGGKSLGPWQLQGVDVSIACNPSRAFAAWLTLAHTVTCKDLPEDEELSALASGSCNKAHKKVSHRADVAREVRVKVLSP